MIAIVTGANSGMGKATVAALADKGYEIIMLCRDSKAYGQSKLVRLENYVD